MARKAPHRLCVLALGFSWSLYFCEEMVSTATMAAGFEESDMLLDKRESPNFRELELTATKAAVYVDSVGVFGQDVACFTVLQRSRFGEDFGCFAVGRCCASPTCRVCCYIITMLSRTSFPGSVRPRRGEIRSARA